METILCETLHNAVIDAIRTFYRFLKDFLKIQKWFNQS